MATLKIGQVNILNKGNFREKYTDLIQTVQFKELDIICVQEVVETKLFEQIMSDNGFPHIVFSDYMPDKYSVGNYCAIISRTPLIRAPYPYSVWSNHIVGATTTVHNYDFNIFTIHSAWGTNNEGNRLRQLENIENIANSLETSNPASISLLAGDLNADSDSRSVRFIKGKDLGSDNMLSTLWLDAYDLAGNDSNWITNDHGKNPLGIETAKRVGIVETDLLPPRRIDYILVRGWKYGRSGCPIDFGYIHHPENKIFTDHNMIYAELLLE